MQCKKYPQKNFPNASVIKLNCWSYFEVVAEVNINDGAFRYSSIAEFAVNDHISIFMITLKEPLRNCNNYED